MFTSIHNHSEYSNIRISDSINKYEDLIKKAISLGHGGIGFTDHEALSGHMKINYLQKKYAQTHPDFKIILGNEIYLVENRENEIKKYYHLILLAKDAEGHRILRRLSSQAWYYSYNTKGQMRVPTLYKELESVMKKGKGHLICTTACIGGEFGTDILNGNEEEAIEFLKWCVKVFGREDFYIEVAPATSKDQLKFNPIAIKIAEKCKIKYIVALDAHYTNKDEFHLFESFLRGENKNRQVVEFYGDCYIMSDDEIREKLNLASKQIETAINRTQEICDKVEFFDLTDKIKIPKTPIIEPECEVVVDTTNYPTIEFMLLSSNIGDRTVIKICLNKLAELGKLNKKYLSRLEEECEVIKWQGDQIDDNFFYYFTTIKWILDLCWEIDCPTGPSRGSNAGSLFCYLMEITQLDPIQWGLHFWRFSHKYRTTVFDSDHDIAPSKQHELFAKIREIRGELNFLQIATFRTLSTKAAIGTACRGYRHPDFPDGIEPDVIIYFNQLIPSDRGQVRCINDVINGNEEKGWKPVYTFINEVNKYPGLLDTIKLIEGNIVGRSTHSAGVALFDKDDKLIDHSSLMRSPRGDICTAYDLHDLEDSGVIKYDLLLLSTLDKVIATFNLLKEFGKINKSMRVKEFFNTYLNGNTADLDNPEIWKLLCNNEIVSVFQFDELSGEKIIRKTQPQNIVELTTANALLRLQTEEGQEDQTERFLRIKSEPQSFIDEMKRVDLPEEVIQIMVEELGEYNGCAVTQESFMILLQRIAGYNLGEADYVRKVVAKKHISETASVKTKLWSKMEELNFTESQIQYFWNVVIQPSLGYGFNRSHALPYSLVGLYSILLSIQFPRIYWQVGCLIAESGTMTDKAPDYDKIAKIIGKISDQGVNVKPISINTSQINFTPDEKTNTIYFGFKSVKGLRDLAVEEIMVNRPFTGLEDFLERTKCDIGSVVALVKSGAFDEFDEIEDIKRILFDKFGEFNITLNGQNIPSLVKQNLIPDIFNKEVKLFKLTQYIRKRTPKDIKENGYYKVEEKAKPYLIDHGWTDFYENDLIPLKAWDKEYNSLMKTVKTYISDNEADLISYIYNEHLETFCKKYFTGTRAIWQIESLGYCFDEHPFANLENKHISDWHELPEEPYIINWYSPKDKPELNIPIYNISIICGYIIATDKMHSTVILLTRTGIVTVKFGKEQFAHYAAQISKKNPDGSKTVIEKPWTGRGTPVLISGIKIDGIFRAKKYKNSAMNHTMYKFFGLNEDGSLSFKEERETGEQEEID